MNMIAVKNYRVAKIILEYIDNEFYLYMKQDLTVTDYKNITKKIDVFKTSIFLCN